MNGSEKRQITRRAFAGATASAFMIVPRHVLGAPFVPPSDKITLATVGLGRQGHAVTMSLLARPEIQVVSVCDVNRGSKDYTGRLQRAAHRGTASAGRGLRELGGRPGVTGQGATHARVR